MRIDSNEAKQSLRTSDQFQCTGSCALAPVHWQFLCTDTLHALACVKSTSLMTEQNANRIWSVDAATIVDQSTVSLVDLKASQGV